MSINIPSVVGRVVESARYDFEIQCKHLAEKYSHLVESEIELMLLVGFALLNVWRVGRNEDCLEILKGDQPSLGDRPVILRSQYRWRDYRIDFCLELKGGGLPVFIECDGHDFHERTKEQAERDRSRDRAIQQAGIPILRFTGREIWRDPGGVVIQILDFLGGRIERK